MNPLPNGDAKTAAFHYPHSVVVSPDGAFVFVSRDPTAGFDCVFRLAEVGVVTRKRAASVSLGRKIFDF